jgi:hypothetical protein
MHLPEKKSGVPWNPAAVSIPASPRSSLAPRRRSQESDTQIVRPKARRPTGVLWVSSRVSLNISEGLLARGDSHLSLTAHPMSVFINRSLHPLQVGKR